MLESRHYPKRRPSRVLSFLGSILLVLALSVAIVWPLWMLATSDRRAYTIAFGLLVAAAVVALFVRGRLARRAEGGRAHGRGGERAPRGAGKGGEA